ncbi:hypothetical protein MPNT_230023 [Candidatus Methylacidithermus pantelleriae]|uniref:Uncharacterized protein n=1 Tax=Candidatus Methylacidithermus pantelleriae TaxID=2744239 RepID=A0A8J2BTG3_9BACT|nr:hypothetical protein MPNT_230023 [Candidatus Methylacidithermus pantelleriae]
MVGRQLSRETGGVRGEVAPRAERKRAASVGERQRPDPFSLLKCRLTERLGIGPNEGDSPWREQIALPIS